MFVIHYFDRPVRKRDLESGIEQDIAYARCGNRRLSVTRCESDTTYMDTGMVRGQMYIHTTFVMRSGG